MSHSDRPANTPEGHTAEEPAPSELGKVGTPGAGKTPAAPHAADAEAVERGGEPASATDAAARTVHEDATADRGAAVDHDPGSHIDGHGAAASDEHGHAEPRVGPIDWQAWGSAAVGAAAGLLVVVLFYLATI